MGSTPPRPPTSDTHKTGDTTGAQPTSQRRSVTARYWAAGIVLTALSTVAVRVLYGIHLHSSALLYIGLPALIAVGMLLSSPRPTDRLGRHLRACIIIMLASSAVLHEGFLCVLFLSPIFLGVVAVTHFAFERWRGARSRGAKCRASILPLVILAASLEGVTPATTFSRDLSVTSTLHVQATMPVLHERMLRPRLLPPSTNWMLSVFPMPTRIDVSGNQPGDVHTVHYTYRRWFVTNAKHGAMMLRIDEVQPNRIAISVLGDTSYLSTYLGIRRTRIDFSAGPDGGTVAQLTIWFERRLDPVWYFEPMLRYAVKTMGDHILNEFLLDRGASHDG